MSNLFDQELDSIKPEGNLFDSPVGKWPQIQPPPAPEPTMIENVTTSIKDNLIEGGEYLKESSDFWKDQGAMAIGGADAAAGFASEMISAPIQGIAGIAGLATGGLDRATRWMENVRDWTTWEPKTGYGKQTLKLAHVPFEKLGEIAQKAGDQQLELFGDNDLGVAMATATATAVQMFPMAFEKVGRLKKAGFDVEPMIERAAEYAKQDPSRANWARRSEAHFQAEVAAQRFGGYPEDYIVDGRFAAPKEPIIAKTKATTKGKKITRAKKRQINKAKHAEKIKQGVVKATKVIEAETAKPLSPEMEVRQNRINEIGIDAFVKEELAKLSSVAQTPKVSTTSETVIPKPAEVAPLATAEVPSVEKINVENEGEANLFDQALDDFNWDEPVDETLFLDDEPVETVSPEVVEEVNSSPKKVRRTKAAKKFVSEDAVIGMEVHQEKFKTKKEAQARIADIVNELVDFSPEDIEIIKIKNHWRMAMSLDEVNVTEAENAVSETVKDLPELNLDSDFTAEEFSNLDNAELRAKKAEETLLNMVNELANTETVEAPPEKDWEALLEDEGMGVDEEQMESADPLDEALDWEEVDEFSDVFDQISGDGVELYSGIPINKLRDIGKAMRTLEMGKAGVRDPLKALSNFASVERPFRQLGWPDLGHAVKTQHERIQLLQDEGRKAAMRITSLKFTPKELGELSLLREQKNRIEITPRQEAGLKVLDSVYDKWTERLKSVGGIQQTFPDSLIARHRERMDLLHQKLEGTKTTKTREKYNAEISKLLKEITQMEKMNYSPILAEWFETMAEEDSVKVGNIFSANPLKRRKTIGYQELIDSGIINIEDLNATKLMLNYVGRISRKYALLHIRQAALRDGAMTSNVKTARKKGYYSIDAQQMPLFKGLFGDGRLIQNLSEMQTGYSRGGNLRTALSTIKGMQFINPLYLGLNNVKQGMMLGSYTNIKVPIYMKKAFQSMYKWDSEFYAAKFNGLSGNPMGDTIKTWDEKGLEAQLPWLDRSLRMLLKNTMPSRHNTYGLKNIGGAASLVRNIYEISHNAAWTFDTFTRMISYHYLRDKGYSQREAAQIAATFHGDYSSVPLKLRQQMTMLLFTPTYKVAMTKLFTAMIEGAGKTATGKQSNEWVKNEQGDYIKEGAHRKTRLYGRSLLYMIGITYGFDKFMMANDWTRDKYAWKYFKEVDTPDGKRELVFTENSPFNLPIKYVLRIYAAASDNSGNGFVGNMIRAFKYEFHPALRTVVYNLAENRTDDGKYIWHVGDDPEIKALKQVEYLTKSWVRMLDIMNPSDRTKETAIILNKEFGKTLSLLMRSSVFTYLRANKQTRAGLKAKRLMTTIRRQAYMDKAGPTVKQIENLQKMFGSIIEEIEGDE